MATAPPLSLGNETPKLNGVPKRVDSFRNPFVPQDSTQTNVSDDIRPSITRGNKEIFTVENQMSKIESSITSNPNNNVPLPTPLTSTHEYHENNSRNPTKIFQTNDKSSSESSKIDTSVLPSKPDPAKTVETVKENDATGNRIKETRNELPALTRPRRNILEPIKRDDSSVTSWSLANGPSVVAMQKKSKSVDQNGKFIGYFTKYLH